MNKLTIITGGVIGMLMVITLAYAQGESGTVNINSASKEELMSIPGVTDSVANNIMEYRQSNGPFCSVDELAGIKGISRQELDTMRSYVSVTDQPLGAEQPVPATPPSEGACPAEPSEGCQ